MAGEYTRINYAVDRGVATITLARPEVANAQDYAMLIELDQAMERAATDGEVRVIVLGAEGKHFSSGHDLAATNDLDAIPPSTTASSFGAPGIEGYLDVEREVYLGYAKRWRTIAKPTIARVQGRVIAGGLLLVWPMDLIVCADNATFADPVVTLGSNGVEYFAHPFEVGIRTAKDMLFTGRELSALEARGLGMVQRIFPLNELVEQTDALARRIAERPAVALAMAKRAANFAQDAMGFDQTLEAAFAMHNILHAHWMNQYDSLAPEGSADNVRSVLKSGRMPGTAFAEEGGK